MAASCDVGKYNDPTVLSLGERLLVLPTGGSMAVISATELALSSQNAQLNRTMFAQMFVRDSAGTGQYRVPFSEALLKAKVGSLTGEVATTAHTFGDLPGAFGGGIGAGASGQRRGHLRFHIIQRLEGCRLDRLHLEHDQTAVSAIDDLRFGLVRQ